MKENAETCVRGAYQGVGMTIPRDGRGNPPTRAAKESAVEESS